jgi:anti-anti-sigma factor
MKKEEKMLEIKKLNDVSVVGLTGELSRGNMHLLDNLLNSLSDCSENNIILNLQNLSHLDYQTVRRIAERIVQFKCDGGDLKMAAANGYIKSIMRAMGLDEEVYQSVEDALLSFVSDDPCGDPQ